VVDRPNEWGFDSFCSSVQLVPATYVQLRYSTKYFGVTFFNKAVKGEIGQIIKK
jgi:hypothetical protein